MRITTVKKMKMLTYVAIVSLGSILFVHTNIWAVPTFGVATSSGTYLEDPNDIPDSDQFNYIQWFLAQYPGGDGYVSGGGHGFAFDGSTATFTVFTNETVADIWLVHENSFSNNDVTFMGDSFSAFPMSGNGNGQIDGYTDRPYWGLNLGPVDTNDGWVELPGNTSNPTGPFNPPQFYALTGEIIFGNALTDEDFGHYFYSAGDTDGDGVIGGEEFSPKTTSAQAVPEPSTMLLLGISLAGLCLYGRQKAKKK